MTERVERLKVAAGLVVVRGRSNPDARLALTRDRRGSLRGGD